MGFWIFMALTVMLFPAIMIVFGRLFSRSAPKEINYAFGYRTSRSMKNMDTWKFAHEFLGKLWFILGFIMIPVNLIPLLLVIGNSENVIGTVGSVLCFVDLGAIIISIFPTESALKKNFDKDKKEKSDNEGP